MQWNDEALHTYLSLQLAINSQIDEMHLVSLDNYMNSETPKNGENTTVVSSEKSDERILKINKDYEKAKQAYVEILTRLNPTIYAMKGGKVHVMPFAEGEAFLADLAENEELLWWPTHFETYDACDAWMKVQFNLLDQKVSEGK